jgi:hypothetical protein
MDFESNTVKQLRIIAKERGVKGYSRLQYSSPLLKLSAILKTARTDSSTAHTHVLLSKPYGKIDVSDNMPEFLTAYLECVDQKLPLSIAERPGLESPVRVDIDLRSKLYAPDADTEPLYTLDNALTVIKAYQTALSESLIDLPDDALTCVLLEKDRKRVEINGVAYCKHGFHLHFPKLFTNNQYAQAYIIPKTQQSLSGLFNRLQPDDVTTDYEFIDDNVCKVHWLMYGSSKPDNQPYLVTRCFNADLAEISLESALGDYCISTFKNEQRIDLRGDAKRVAYYLPRILSIALYDRSEYYYESKQSVNTPIVDNCSRLKQERPFYANKNITELLTEAATLLELLSDARADDRKDWFLIGVVLYNIAAGDSDGLDLWLEFSDRSPKYNEVECLSIWTKLRLGNCSIGTLKYFAKCDNPEAYDALCRSRRTELFRS